MTSEHLRLGDHAALTVGFVGTMTPYYRPSGVPFVRSKDVLPHRIDTQDLLFVEPEFEARISKSRLQTGDVVIVRTGAPGTAAVVPPALDGANCSDLVVVRPDATIDPRWLSYYINAAAQESIQAHTVGAVQQHFNVGAAKELRLPPLSLPEQRAIGEVLGALDDKIAANRELIERADTLRRALWLRVTRGGTSAPLSSTAEFINGGAYTKDASGTGRVVIRIAELNSGISRATVRSEINVPEHHVVRPGDLLMSWSGSLVSHRWFRDEAVLNQHIFKVIPRPGWRQWSAACAVEAMLPVFRDIAADKATTMGHIQRAHLDLSLALPSPNELAAVDSAGQTLWQRALAAEVESERLAATRDELLPLLMDGRITVKSAEKTVEGVL